MTLLCHICQSPTLWSGSGPKFGPTISVCPTCLGAKNDARHHNNNSNARDLNTGVGRVVADEDLDQDDDDDEEEEEEDDNDDDDDDDGDDGFEDGDEHEDDEENQVVPWSYSVSHPR
ncbi:PH domain-containing protein YHR131C-like [Chenopodium quinoa]|uniref:PH domain-containing protein YHR131C-like n=1 Tax=Chenopodium quinoa TaxID=63459 RepID=UPI000B799594|nr:PH domain-containing protein YHR131C-like [Chenopodium quinoa]